MRDRLGVLFAAVALCAVVTPVTAASGVAMKHPLVGLRHSTSSNWSGYAAYGGKSGQFSSVRATWVQPAVTCTSQARYSAFWVGLDGYNTNTVEQLGTEADCVNGSAVYSAWYEMYPHWSIDITSTVAVAANHTYTASVTYAGGSNYALTLDDVTSGQHFGTTQKLASAKRASAEIIAEAPWSSGALPLANFGTINFSGSTVNGAALKTFASLDPMTMVDPNGGTATPSPLDSKTGQSFSIAWSNS